MLDLLYVLAGAGAIVLIFGSVFHDALTMARWVASLRPIGLEWTQTGRTSYRFESAERRPFAWSLHRGRALVGLAALVALWLVAAWLR